MFSRTQGVPRRYEYLVHNVITGTCIFILVIAFIRAKDRTGYADMLLALGGTHAVSSVGRFFTKKNSDNNTAQSDDDKG